MMRHLQYDLLLRFCLPLQARALSTCHFIGAMAWTSDWMGLLKESTGPQSCNRIYRNWSPENTSDLVYLSLLIADWGFNLHVHRSLRCPLVWTHWWVWSSFCSNLLLSLVAGFPKQTFNVLVYFWVTKLESKSSWSVMLWQNSFRQRVRSFIQIASNLLKGKQDNPSCAFSLSFVGKSIIDYFSRGCLFGVCWFAIQKGPRKWRRLLTHRVPLPCPPIRWKRTTAFWVESDTKAWWSYVIKKYPVGWDFCWTGWFWTVLRWFGWRSWKQDMEANCGFLHRLDVPCSGLVPWAFQSHEDEGMVCVVVVREIQFGVYPLLDIMQVYTVGICTFQSYLLIRDVNKIYL